MLYRIIHNTHNRQLLENQGILLPDPIHISGLSEITCGLRESKFHQVKDKICFIPVMRFNEFGIFNCEVGETPNIIEFPDESDHSTIKEKEEPLLHCLLKRFSNSELAFSKVQFDFEKSNNLTTMEELCEFMFKLKPDSVIRVVNDSINQTSKEDVLSRIITSTPARVTRNCLYPTRTCVRDLGKLAPGRAPIVRITSKRIHKSGWTAGVFNDEKCIIVNLKSANMFENHYIAIVETKENKRVIYTINAFKSTIEDSFVDINYSSILNWLDYTLPRYPSLDYFYTHFNSIPNSKYTFTRVAGRQEYDVTPLSSNALRQMNTELKKDGFVDMGLILLPENYISKEECKKIIDELYEVEGVTWIKQEDNNLIVFTDNLSIAKDVVTADELRPTFFGRYRLEFAFIKGANLKFVSCRNISYTAKVPAYGKHHPHNTGDITRYCFGNASDMLAYALKEKNRKLYLTVLIKYLSQANKYDSAGKRYTKWLPEFTEQVYTYSDD